MEFDARSLAAFRVCVGVRVAWNAWWSLFDFANVFLSSSGFVPASFVDSPPWLLSCFFWFGLPGTRLLLLLTVCFALAFALGWKTRFSGWLTWFMLASLHFRNPLISQSGDALLRSLLFFANFLPLGRVYSVDAGIKWFHREQRRPSEQEGSASKQARPGSTRRQSDLATIVAHYAFLGQLGCFLFFGGVAKLGLPQWSSECSGVSLLLLGPYATFVGRIWEALLPGWYSCLLSRLSPYCDMLLALLLLVPLSRVRSAVAVAIGVSALLLGLCLRSETLWWSQLCGCLVLLPASVWRCASNSLKTVSLIILLRRFFFL